MKLEYKVPKGWRRLKVGEDPKSWDRSPYKEKWKPIDMFLGAGGKVRKSETIIRRIKTK